MNPEVLILDEPAVGLDSLAVQRLLNIIKELNQRGVTIIMITHSRSIAQTADRVLQVSDGVLTDFGRCRQ
mgnify:CR=1 FL=1